MGIVFDQSLNTTDDVRFTGISLRDGTSASDISIYKTYTSDSDYERLDLKWDSGVPVIGVAVGSGGGNYPNWIQIENESSKFLVKHNGFEFQDATTLLQLNPTNIKVFKDLYPNNDDETSFGTSSNRWRDIYSFSGSFSGDLVVEDGGNQYIYNTYTDASNYERLEIKWDSNTAMIEATSDGTGSNRTVAMGNGSGVSVAEFSVTGVKTAHIRPKTHRIYTLGNGIARWKATYTSGLATDVETFTATDTLDDQNQVCLCNATTGNITLNLPVASSTPSGTQYQIKKIDSSSNTVIITPNSGAGDLIDGSATYTLSNQWEGAIIVCDGADWFITGGVTNSGGGGGGGGGLGGGD